MSVFKSTKFNDQVTALREEMKVTVSDKNAVEMADEGKMWDKALEAAGTNAEEVSRVKQAGDIFGLAYHSTAGEAIVQHAVKNKDCGKLEHRVSTPLHDYAVEFTRPTCENPTKDDYRSGLAFVTSVKTETTLSNVSADLADLWD